ncbi:hypothetical protein TcWFU_004623 [Taenia crassiceps]|uniref:Uncharacterized protein n=1 Tax=Taenia crassiceps TaxID=6207 RepID=A0ABR4QQM3_9CEST
MDSKRVSQHSLEVNQIDTPCDSGINSLNSKETQKVKVKNCFQADFSPAQGAEEQLLHRQSGIIDEDLSKNVKAYLSSDAIPKINASDHLKVRERADFINFTYRLIGGLRNCMTAAEGFSSKDNDYDQMKLRYTTLKWKAETVSRLLQEYKEILENTGGKSEVLTGCPRITSEDGPITCDFKEALSLAQHFASQRGAGGDTHVSVASPPSISGPELKSACDREPNWRPFRCSSTAS